MTANRYFFGVLGILACAGVAIVVGEWLADLTGLRWVLFPIGLVTVLSLNHLFEPFFTKAIKDGYRRPVRRSDFSLPSRLVGLAVFLSLAAYVWWRGTTFEPAPFMLGVVLGLALRPMPRNPEAFAHE